MEDGDSVHVHVRKLGGQLWVTVKRQPSGMESDSGPVGVTMLNALDWAWRVLTCGTDEAFTKEPQGRPLGRLE
jgi:hypothetical protein